MVQAGPGTVFEEDTLDGEKIQEMSVGSTAPRPILNTEVKTKFSLDGLPFEPSLASSPMTPPPSRLEGILAWLGRRRPILLLVLAILVVLSAYLAFQSQSRDINSSTGAAAQSSDIAQEDEAGKNATSSEDPAEDGEPQTARLGDGDSRSSGPSEPSEPSEPATSERQSPTSATNAPSTTATPTTASTPSTTVPSTEGTAVSTTIEATTTEAPATVVPPTAPPTTEAPTTVPATTVTPTTVAPTTVATTIPLPLTGRNELSNGGFENYSVPPGNYRIVSAVGWSSSDGRMEIWGSGHNDIAAVGGRHFAELNSVGPVAISQRVSVVPGATFTWSFFHRGRVDRDTVEVLIDGQVVATRSTGTGRWIEYSGEVVVPNGQETMEFGLRPIDSGSSGNLVDRVTFVRTQNP